MRRASAWTCASNAPDVVTARSPIGSTGCTGELRERQIDVGARLGRQAEHALAHDVPLDLVSAAPDGDGRAGEEQRLPLPVAVDSGDPVRAEEVEGERRGGLEAGAPSQLRPRSLGAGGPARLGGVAGAA